MNRVLAWGVLGLLLIPACRERVPASSLSRGSASEAPAPAPPPSAPSPVTCRDACAPGTACHLTAKGPACVACAPGSAPTCKDARTVAICGDDGALHAATDCAAQQKRCDRGRCTARECAPGALHCFEGDVFRCDADGDGRALVTRCVVATSDGLDASKGLCQVKNGVPACRTGCDLPDHTIVALHSCEACAWEGVPFCATESPERACADWICIERKHTSPGAVAIPCWRDTDGLVVPGSELRGACEGAGAIGAREVGYQICRDGKPSPARRVEPCAR